MPTDATAADVLRRYSAVFRTTHPEAPTPRIRAYVEALLGRWVDLTEDDEDEDLSPWSTGPLINEASGPVVYFPMRFSMAGDVSAEAARMAAERGLVCFDPQDDGMRPTREERAGGADD